MFNIPVAEKKTFPAEDTTLKSAEFCRKRLFRGIEGKK